MAGPGYGFDRPGTRGKLIFAGGAFALPGLAFAGLGAYGAYLTLTGQSAIDPGAEAALAAVSLAFGIPFAMSGILLLALPRRPGLATAADRALVVLSVSVVAACVVVALTTGRPMALAAVGGLSAVKMFRDIVRRGGIW